jgi:uncharacterized protein (DUF849 family)
MSSEKTIVNFCPTGMVPRKSDTPHVPVSVSEIVEQVHEAAELGITIVHLHARHENGEPAWQPEIYQEIFERVRKHCPELIICGSTSGREVSEFEKRSAVIELQPDMCSLTLSSLNFVDNASVNEPEIIRKLAEKMNRFGVKAELECFGLGMVNMGKYLIGKGIVETPAYWNLLFGNIAGIQGTLSHMGTASSDIPDSHYVSFAGIGSAQHPVTSTAVAMGYGVRIGVEDNIWYDKSKRSKATNIDLLKRIHKLIDIHEKGVMPPRDLRKKEFCDEKE